jgi:glycosyltransferase involved in cell wall biosynthesis
MTAPNILVIHNAYGAASGEEAVVDAQQRLLEAHGHKVSRYERSSAEIDRVRLGKAHAFVSGVYNPSSRRAVSALIASARPDIVHVHNLYPLISPSILSVCNEVGVPVVMTVHNYRLICPNGLFMNDGIICEKCCGGREWQCVLNNCEDNIFKSMGYALRNYVARKKRYYKDNITRYMALTEFQRRQLIVEGFEAEKISVVPNFCTTHHDTLPSGHGSRVTGHGDYVGYAGRMSPEKGLHVLHAAARVCADVPFYVAGSCDRMPSLLQSAPTNMRLLGFLAADAMQKFYCNMRFMVLPSICYEAFPMTILEAAAQGKPVICSRLGGLPEIVDDGETGLLFEPRNHEDLADKIRYLWDRPKLCRELGEAARAKARREYSPDRYYERLMRVYNAVHSL